MKRKNTYIYNRWQGYTLADCACELCKYYDEKSDSCILDICCCEEERHEALLRESSIVGEAPPDKAVVQCPV